MKWVTASTTILFDATNNIIPKTTGYAQLPSQRVTKEKVINRNGEYTFVDGLNNKQVTMDITQAYDIITARRLRLRDLAPYLIREGKLYLDYENDIYWEGRVLSQSDIKLDKGLDILTVTFDLDPLAFSTLTNDIGVLTWGDAEIDWGSTDIEWGDDIPPTEFAIGTHTITNLGNYTSKPKWIVSGAGTITVGTQEFEVTEACTVDTENLIVYNGTTTKMSAFTGDFINIAPGESTLVTDVAIEVVNKDRWL